MEWIISLKDWLHGPNSITRSPPTMDSWEVLRCKLAGRQQPLWTSRVYCSLSQKGLPPFDLKTV